MPSPLSAVYPCASIPWLVSTAARFRDIGENYNVETRLSILNENTWGISRTNTYYLRQYSIPPFAIRRADTSYFYYCHGIAEAIDNYSDEENAQYSKDAVEVRDIFLSPDIADIIRSIKQ